MISFAVLTDTPARLRNFLISRGVVTEEVVQVTGQPDQTIYVGTLPGMEWVEIPNPIITDNSDPENPVYDTRRVFLVKFSRDSESQKATGFRDWLMANTSVVTPPAGWTIRGQPLGAVRKVNGENVWLAHLDPDRFGTWQ